MDLEFPKRRGRVGERARGRKSDSTPYALGSMLLLPLRRSKLCGGFLTAWESPFPPLAPVRNVFPREWEPEWQRMVANNRLSVSSGYSVGHQGRGRVGERARGRNNR